MATISGTQFRAEVSTVPSFLREPFQEKAAPTLAGVSLWAIILSITEAFVHVFLLLLLLGKPFSNNKVFLSSFYFSWKEKKGGDYSHCLLLYLEQFPQQEFLHNKPIIQSDWLILIVTSILRMYRLLNLLRKNKNSKIWKSACYMVSKAFPHNIVTIIIAIELYTLK